MKFWFIFFIGSAWLGLIHAHDVSQVIEDVYASDPMRESVVKKFGLPLVDGGNLFSDGVNEYTGDRLDAALTHCLKEGLLDERDLVRGLFSKSYHIRFVCLNYCINNIDGFSTLGLDGYTVKNDPFSNEENWSQACRVRERLLGCMKNESSVSE